MPPSSSKIRVLIARHTQPEGGDVWTILGHKDTPLSAEGRRHWEELAAELREVPIEIIYSSDLSRSWWCADLVASQRGLPAHRLKELREMDCGKLDGMTRERATVEYPEAFEGMKKDPANYRIPGGETLQEVSDRVLPVIERIRSGGSKCALVVAHAVVNRAIICDALGLPLSHAYRIEQSYGGITIIDYRPIHPILHTINAPCVPSRFRNRAD